MGDRHRAVNRDRAANGECSSRGNETAAYHRGLPSADRSLNCIRASALWIFSQIRPARGKYPNARALPESTRRVCGIVERPRREIEGTITCQCAVRSLLERTTPWK